MYTDVKNNIKDLLNSIFAFRKNLVRNYRFRGFRENYLNLSEKNYNEENLPNGKEYDLVVAGSDQVWSFLCNNNDTHYFLDMIDISVPCISYAASMAQVDLTEEEKEKYSTLLKRFEYISVREKEAADLLQPLVNKEIYVSPDPSFLLTKEEWCKLAETPKEEAYIFVFTVAKPDAVMEKAQELSKRTGYKLVCLNMGSIKYEHRFGSVFPVSPAKWLGYIKNAKYIITDSFHGTAFSIVFEKNFTSLIKADAGKNSRISNLLETLDLTQCGINPQETIEYKDIDYRQVNDKVDEFRIRGINFIEDMTKRFAVKK